MANTYTRIYIHVVFAVRGRQNLILQKNKEELHMYISGIINKRGQKPLAVNCMPDHIHLLIGIKPNIKISDLIRDIKTGSSHFIKKKEWNQRFSWQLGFGAFSYAHSQLDTLINYIANQEKHHLKTSFRKEYFTLLKRFDIQYNGKHLFEFFD